AGATGPTASGGARGRPWSACHARRRRQRDGDGGFRESCLTPVIMSLSHTLYCRSLGEVGMRLLVSALLLGLCPAALDAQEVDWSANGRDAQGTRYSPASQITRKNVSGLEVAWTYRTGETDPRFKTGKPTAFEATPLLVDGTMYLGTPLGRVIALDPGTGRERWVFDPKIK